MKGLILKDFINLKKQSKVIGVLVVFYFLLSITTKNNSMFGAMMLILFAMMPITAISYDEKANWDKYGLTMPVSRTEMVLSKYILGLILSTFALVLNFIVQILMGTEMNTENITIIFVIFGVSIIFISLLLPIMFKFGVEKGRMLMILVLMLPTIIIMLLPEIFKTPPPEEMIIKVLYALPFIIVIIYVLSIFISINIYNKKEF